MRRPSPYHLGVMIPLANEEATVSELLRRVCAQIESTDSIFCVVDHASKDDTRQIVRRESEANSQIKLVSFGGFIHSDDITLFMTFHIKNLTFTGTTVLDDSPIIQTESFQAKSNHYFLVEDVTFADVVFASKGAIISFEHAASAESSVIHVRNSEFRNNSNAPISVSNVNHRDGVPTILLIENCTFKSNLAKEETLIHPGVFSKVIVDDTMFEGNLSSA